MLASRLNLDLPQPHGFFEPHLVSTIPPTSTLIGFLHFFSSMGSVYQIYWIGQQQKETGVPEGTPASR
jgi:hypothetical protein